MPGKFHKFRDALRKYVNFLNQGVRLKAGNAS